MRKLLLPCGLFCALLFTAPASAGDSHSPGDDCPPEPQICVPADGGGTNATAPPDGEFGAVIVEGALLIFGLLP